MFDEFQDLFEVGDKVKESVEELSTSDVGDITLEIQKTLRQLREDEDSDQDRIKHLEGLLGELLSGEEYGMRDSEEDPKLAVPSPYVGGQLQIPPGAISGVLGGGMVASGVFNPIAPALPVQPILPRPHPTLSPVPPTSTSFPDEADWDDDEDYEEDEIEDKNEEPVVLPKKWWRTQAVEPKHDDSI